MLAGNETFVPVALVSLSQPSDLFQHSEDTVLYSFGLDENTQRATVLMSF